MTLTFSSVYLTSAGSFLPGAPIDDGQVRYGSHWMRRAAERIGEPFLALRPRVAARARAELEDYGILLELYLLQFQYVL